MTSKSNCGIVAYGGTVAFCSNQILHHLWIRTKQIAPNNTKSYRSPHCCDRMIPESPLEGTYFEHGFEAF